MKTIRSDFKSIQLDSQGFSKNAQDSQDIDLTFGEPSQSTHEDIKAEAIKHIIRNDTLYAPAAGILPLRQAISDSYRLRNNVHYDVDEITVTNGATQSLTAVLLTILNVGDEVIVPKPCFMLYEPTVQLARGTVVEYSTIDDDFQINREKLEALITPKTKAIIYTSPGNPTGTLYNEESDRIMVEIAEKYGIFVICDDIYELITFKPIHPLYLHQEIRKNIIICQSFSKSYAMTGWRMGWVIADRSISDDITRACLIMVTAVSTPSQYAAVKCFDIDNTYLVNEFKDHCDYTCQRLDEMKLPYVQPEGAFYVFPDISEFKRSSREFAEEAARQFNVRVLDGYRFGSESDDHIRISYVCTKERLIEGLDRLKAYVDSLRL